jgi:hypothetical protein
MMICHCNSQHNPAEVHPPETRTQIPQLADGQAKSFGFTATISITERQPGSSGDETL